MADSTQAKKLYDNLTDDGYNLGSFDEFKALDPTKRRKLYDNLIDDGYNLGDYTSFSQVIAPEDIRISKNQVSTIDDAPEFKGVLPEGRFGDMYAQAEQIGKSANNSTEKTNSMYDDPFGLKAEKQRKDNAVMGIVQGQVRHEKSLNDIYANKKSSLDQERERYRSYFRGIQRPYTSFQVKDDMNLEDQAEFIAKQVTDADVMKYISDCGYDVNKLSEEDIESLKASMAQGLVNNLIADYSKKSKVTNEAERLVTKIINNSITGKVINANTSGLERNIQSAAAEEYEKNANLGFVRGTLLGEGLPILADIGAMRMLGVGGSWIAQGVNKLGSKAVASLASRGCGWALNNSWYGRIGRLALTQSGGNIAAGTWSMGNYNIASNLIDNPDAYMAVNKDTGEYEFSPERLAKTVGSSYLSGLMFSMVTAPGNIMSAFASNSKQAIGSFVFNAASGGGYMTMENLVEKANELEAEEGRPVSILDLSWNDVEEAAVHGFATDFIFKFQHFITEPEAFVRQFRKRGENWADPFNSLKWKKEWSDQIGNGEVARYMETGKMPSNTSALESELHAILGDNTVPNDIKSSIAFSMTGKYVCPAEFYDKDYRHCRSFKAEDGVANAVIEESATGFSVVCSDINGSIILKKEFATENSARKYISELQQTIENNNRYALEATIGYATDEERASLDESGFSVEDFENSKRNSLISEARAALGVSDKELDSALSIPYNKRNGRQRAIVDGYIKELELAGISSEHKALQAASSEDGKVTISVDTSTGREVYVKVDDERSGYATIIDVETGEKRLVRRETLGEKIEAESSDVAEELNKTPEQIEAESSAEEERMTQVTNEASDEALKNEHQSAIEESERRKSEAPVFLKGDDGEMIPCESYEQDSEGKWIVRDYDGNEYYDITGDRLVRGEEYRASMGENNQSQSERQEVDSSNDDAITIDQKTGMPDVNKTSSKRAAMFFANDEAGIGSEYSEGVLNAKIDEARKRVESANAKKPKLTPDINKFKSEKDRIEKEKLDSETELKYWEDVLNEYKKLKSKTTNDAEVKSDSYVSETQEGNNMHAQEEAAKESAKPSEVKADVVSSEPRETVVMKNSNGEWKNRKVISRNDDGSVMLDGGEVVSEDDINKASNEYAAIAENDKKVQEDTNVGLVRDSKVEGYDEEQLGVIDKVAKRLGLRVQFVDEVDGGLANASYRKGSILIERGNRNPIDALMGHEVLHSLKENNQVTYQKFVEAIVDAVGDRQFYNMVGEQIKLYDGKISNEDAIEEVAANFAGSILRNSEMLDKFVEKSDLTAIGKMKDFFNRVDHWLNDDFVTNKVYGGDIDFSTVFMMSQKEFNQIGNRLAEAYKLAENIEFNDKLGHNATDAASVDDKAIDLSDCKNSIKTEAVLRKNIEQFIKDKKELERLGWTPERVREAAEEVTDIINLIHSQINGNPDYDQFAKKDPTLSLDWRDGEEKPIVTWSRNNIEYKYDMSADTFCINNDGMETMLSHPAVADLMIHMSEYTMSKTKGKAGEKSGFKSDDYLRLYEVMRDMGFVVPCKGCFDAAARLKMLPSVAQNFTELVNETIDERNKNPEKFDRMVMELSSNKTASGYPAGAKTQKQAVMIGVAGDKLTEHINFTQLMSAEGQTKALTDWGGIYRAWQRTGAGRPKDKLLPEPYIGDIVSQYATIIAPYGAKTPSFRDLNVNDGTGLRRNSHSEFRPTLAIDEIQFMRDAWLKKLCVFKYMKELDDVRLSGNMGVKFNMSAFPAWYENGVAAGLDENGELAIAEESVGGREFPLPADENGVVHYDGYRGLEEARKYINKDVSLSSVAFSVPHLIKLMTDVPTPSNKVGMWGSLIPFHSSGATAHQLLVQGLGHARAANSGTFLKEAFFDYNKGVTNFEDVQNDRYGEGYVVIAGDDKGKSAAGHKLEYPKADIIRNEKLGVTIYKGPSSYDGNKDRVKNVSGKFYTLDSENNRVIHSLDVDYNNKVREIGTEYAYKDAADFYVNELRSIGIEPRFDFNVPEDAFLQMCKDANVDPNHPKLGWKGDGNDWSPCDAESYYSLFCDYGMTDPETGKLAPHRPVLDGNTDPMAFRNALPENYIDIIKNGLSRYTERRVVEDSRINEAIVEYCRRSIEEGKMSEEESNNILEKHGVIPGNKLSKKSNNSDKSLIGVHNISEDNLRKAIKLGGLANPSAAVVDLNKSGHSSFGDISLIMPSSLVDSRTGDNAGTWTDDVYTPVFPSSSTVFTKKGRTSFAKTLSDAADGKSFGRWLESNVVSDLQEGRMPSLEWLFLKEKKGVDTTSYEHRGFNSNWEDIFDNFKTTRSLRTAMSSDEKLSKDVKNLVSLYVRGKVYEENPELDINKIIEREGTDSALKTYRQIKPLIEEAERKYMDEAGNFRDEYIDEAFNANKKIYSNHEGVIDNIHTVTKARKYVYDKGLESEYGKWLDSRLEDFGIETRFIDGNDRYGNARYVPGTLDNASSIMNKDVLTGGHTLGGWGAFISKVAKRLHTTEDIRQNKDMIAASEELRHETENTFSDFAILINDKTGLDLWSGDASKSLANAVNSGNAVEYFKDRLNIELDEDDANKLRTFEENVRRGVANFFETKFQRPVKLNEFASAVVPKGTSQDIIDGLSNSGIDILYYDPKKEGDRERVQKKASNKEGVRFSKKGSASAPIKRKEGESLKDYTQRVLDAHESYKQNHGSALTSLNQVPRATKILVGDGRLKEGTLNLDMGGGRYNTATDYLNENGVENLVFDPFNRDSEHNKSIAERVQKDGVDTVTCNNVLNVIDTEGARLNVILQCAKALKKDGAAYFSIYEGSGSGEAKDTKNDRWQNNKKTSEYVDEVKTYFNDVTLKNGIITARDPKETNDESVWQFDGKDESAGNVKFSKKAKAENADSVTLLWKKGDDESKPARAFDVTWRATGRSSREERDSKYGVGKRMIGVYFHKNYAQDVIPEDVLDKALSVVPDWFKYNCMYYNEKEPSIVRFDEAPDFDSAREPIPGNMIFVDTESGSIIPDSSGNTVRNSNQIWHHKWEWVKDDYDGFDVQDSFDWSVRWKDAFDNQPLGIGSKRVWDECLRSVGLPIDNGNNDNPDNDPTTPNGGGGKYSLKANGSLRDLFGGNDKKAKTATYFSGGGLLEQGLIGAIDPSIAVEFKPNIAGVYKANNGDHIVVSDVTKFDVNEALKKVDGGHVSYFHASPVCKNFSTMKTDMGEQELDIVTARATADAIEKMMPEVFTLENVPNYRNSDAMKLITDKLESLGYEYDAAVYNAADYGAPTSRRRLILRAAAPGLTVPPRPAHTERSKGWFYEVEDLMGDAKSAKLPDWIIDRAEKIGLDIDRPEKPLFVSYGTRFGGLAYAYADEVIPAITASGTGERIIMPNGDVFEVSPRMLARLSGLPDSYKLPMDNKTLAHTIIGNGIPTYLSSAVIAPMVESRINKYAEKKKITDKVESDYLMAAKNNDIETATRLFNEYVLNQADDNIVPVLYAESYRTDNHDKIAKMLKETKYEAVRMASQEMAKKVPDNAVLIPMPSHEGTATDTKVLAEEIGKITGCPVMDILKGFSRESAYAAKKSGHKLTPEMMGMRLTSDIPEGKIPIFVDNVIDKGTTGAAAVRAANGGIVLAYAKTRKMNGDIAIKSAEPIVHDNYGAVIPLSQRFDRSSKDFRYSRKVNMTGRPLTESPADEARTNLDAMRSTIDKMMADQNWVSNRLGRMRPSANSAKDIKTMVSDLKTFVNERLSKQVSGELGMKQIESILTQIDAAANKQDLRTPLRKIQSILNMAQLKYDLKSINKTLSKEMKKVGQNGVAQGKNIDHEMKVVFDDVRRTWGNLFDNENGTMSERVSLSKDRIQEEQRLNDDEIARLIDDGKDIPEDVAFKASVSIPLRKMAASIGERISEMEDAKAYWKSVEEELKTFHRNRKVQMSESERADYYREQAEIRSRMWAAEDEYIRLQREVANETYNLNGMLKERWEEGRERLKEMAELEVERKRRVLGMAFKDYYRNNLKIEGETGRPGSGKPITAPSSKASIEEKVRTIKDGATRLIDFYNSPSKSFQYILKNVPNYFSGEGNLYEHFFRNPETSIITAENTRTIGLESFGRQLNDAASRIAGFKDFVEFKSDSENELKKQVPRLLTENDSYDWNDRKVHGQSDWQKGEVMFMNGMTKGNALYAWLTWQQPDGKMKLMSQGYTEETMQSIEEQLGSKYLEFGKWMTDEFLPTLRRDRYNPKHVEIFGTDMAENPNYFPIRVDKTMLKPKKGIEESDIDSRMQSVKTPAILERVRNNAKVDVFGNNALDVIVNYGEQMEGWHAFASVIRDLNSLNSSVKFKRMMEANHTGSFDEFMDAALTAVGNHGGMDMNGFIDKASGFINKTISTYAQGAIGFRLMTALKQTTSYPAFSTYSADPRYHLELMYNLARPVSNINWCKDNLPMFRQRINDGDMGLEGMNDKVFFDTLTRKYSKYGMKMNRAIDQLTIACGARAVYDLNFRRFTDSGMSAKEAHDRAVIEATITYNESQQSNVGAFSSPVQKSKTPIVRSLALFRNASFGYGRMLRSGMLDIVKSFDPSVKMKDGESASIARRIWNSLGGLANAVNFGLVLPYVWAGAGNTNHIFGSNDSDEDEAMETAMWLGVITDGSILSSPVATYAGGQEWTPFAVFKDIKDLVDKAKDSGESNFFLYAARKASLYGVGFNFDTWHNMYAGASDLFANADSMTSRELLLDCMLLSNVNSGDRNAWARKLYSEYSPVQYAKAWELVNKKNNETKDMSNRAKEWVGSIDRQLGIDIRKFEEGYLKEYNDALAKMNEDPSKENTERFSEISSKPEFKFVIPYEVYKSIISGAVDIMSSSKTLDVDMFSDASVKALRESVKKLEDMWRSADGSLVDSEE